MVVSIENALCNVNIKILRIFQVSRVLSMADRLTEIAPWS